MPEVLTDVSQRPYRENICAHCEKPFMTQLETVTLCIPCFHMGHRSNLQEACWKCKQSHIPADKGIQNFS